MTQQYFSDQGISRRAFLGGSVLAGAGLAATALINSSEAYAEATSEQTGGVDINGFWKFPATEYTLEDAKETIECDIAVLGAGAAGLCAALKAAELGKSVVLVERGGDTGGSAAFSEGIFGIGTRYQQESGVEVTEQEVFETTMEYSHYRARPKLVKNFIQHSGATVDWFEEHGVVFHDVLSVVATNPDSLRTWHLYEGMGAQAFRTLSDEAIAAGVDLHVNTTASNLLFDEDGNVVGVACLDDSDNILAVVAKAVIVCTGGYGENDEMKREFLSDRWNVDRLVSIGAQTHNGEGINMCVAAGAKPYNVGVINTHTAWNTQMGMSSSLFAVQQEPFLWVNLDGERFVNERAVCVDPALQGNAHSYQPEMLARTIVDSDTIEMLREGIPFPLGAFFPAGTALTDIDEALADGIGKGIAFKADSIEDLAEQLGMDPAVLSGTVETYNAACENGVDDEFYKLEDMLIPVKTPPFYAVVTDSYSFTSTIGGILINENAQALDMNNEPIPGLYVCGSDASGLYGDSYEFVLSGSTIGFAANTGVIAAEHACETLF